MPAHEKVSVQEIVDALQRWRGNLQAVASELGLNRGALYERIQRVGIDLSGFRGAETTGAEADAIPIRAASRRRPVARLEPENMEHLREARLDLMARYRVEVDVGPLLNQFFRETFPEWVRSKLTEKGGRQ